MSSMVNVPASPDDTPAERPQAGWTKPPDAAASSAPPAVSTPPGASSAAASSSGGSVTPDSSTGEASPGGKAGSKAEAQREVRYEYSRNLPAVLAELNASLLISTYQAGKLALVGARAGQLTLSFHNFDRPMGVAVDPGGNRMAVAARDKIWRLNNDRDIAAQLDESGGTKACLLTRSAHVTGEIQAHELAWGRDGLWLVNTLFSCLCTIEGDYSFVPRWRPPFITALAAEDRCHLNGLAMLDGQPRYATAMAMSDAPAAWRENKNETGCLIDTASGETVASGFAMPHSPRLHLGQIWLLDSGRGSLVRIDPADGRTHQVARFPGYTRGLALAGPLALVGLSRIRETSTFGGVPIAEDRERLKCGVAVVNVQTGTLVGQFEFTSGVEEIFDVSLLPGAPQAVIRGPFAADDGDQTIWKVPKECA